MGFRAILASGVGEFFCMLRGKTLEELGSPEEVPHNLPEGIGIHAREVPVHHDDQVDRARDLSPVEADIFSKPSLCPIPSHGITETTGDGQAKAASRAGAAADEQAQVPRGNLFAPPDHGPELTARANAIRLRKTLPHLWPPPHLY